MRVFDANTGQWRDAPTPTEQSAPGGVTLLGGTYVRGNDPNQTVQGQMTGLLNSNSDYMRINEKKGQQFAASRGLLNSTLAGQSGRKAAIEGAMPIAMADAQTAAQAAGQNADSLNAIAIAKMQRDTLSAQGGNFGVIQNNAMTAEQEEARQMRIMRLASQLNISEADAGRVFEREQSGADRSWRSGEAGADRDWRSRESGIGRDFEAGQATIDRGWRSGESAADRDARIAEAERDRGYGREGWAREDRNTSRDQRATVFRDVMSGAFNTIFSNPSMWRDQAGSRGFLEFFTGGNLRSMLDSFFGGGGSGLNGPGGG